MECQQVSSFFFSKSCNIKFFALTQFHLILPSLSLSLSLTLSHTHTHVSYFPISLTRLGSNTLSPHRLFIFLTFSSTTLSPAHLSTQFFFFWPPVVLWWFISQRCTFFTLLPFNSICGFRFVFFFFIGLGSEPWVMVFKENKNHTKILKLWWILLTSNSLIYGYVDKIEITW